MKRATRPTSGVPPLTPYKRRRHAQVVQCLTFFLEDTPTAVLCAKCSVAQFEKATTVAKLAAARRRKRVANGKCEGRKSLAEIRPEVVALAKALGRKKPKGGKMSLRAVSLRWRLRATSTSVGGHSIPRA